MKKRKHSKLIASAIILFVAFVGVGTAIVLAPQSQVASVHASAVEYENGEHIVTFKTIDGVIISAIFTVDGRLPIEYIPNAPQIDKRPFLRWTNVQGFALDGVFTQDVTFLPLYSYDPQWQVDNNGNGSKIPDTNTDGSTPFRKTQWLFMNYVLDENTVIFGSLIGFAVIIFLVFTFLILLKGVLK